MFLRLSAHRTHNHDRPRRSVPPQTSRFRKRFGLIKNENCGTEPLVFDKMVFYHAVKTSERSEGWCRLIPVIPLTGKTTQQLSFAPSVFHQWLFPEQTVAESKSRAKLRCVSMERQLRGSGEIRSARSLRGQSANGLSLSIKSVGGRCGGGVGVGSVM